MRDLFRFVVDFALALAARLAVFSFLAATTCAHTLDLGRPYWERVDLPIQVSTVPRFTDAVEDAIDGWNRQVGCEVFRLVPEGRVHVVQVTRSSVFAGLTHCLDGACLVSMYPTTEESYAIASWVSYHELGHVLGLGHDPDRASVMFDTVPRDYLSTSYWGDRSWIPRETARLVRRWYCRR